MLTIWPGELLSHFLPPYKLFQGVPLSMEQSWKLGRLWSNPWWPETQTWCNVRCTKQRKNRGRKLYLLDWTMPKLSPSRWCHWCTRFCRPYVAGWYWRRVGYSTRSIWMYSTRIFRGRDDEWFITRVSVLLFHAMRHHILLRSSPEFAKGSTNVLDVNITWLEIGSDGSGGMYTGYRCTRRKNPWRERSHCT